MGQRFLTCAYREKSSSQLPLFNEKQWFLRMFWSELPWFLVVDVGASDRVGRESLDGDEILQNLDNEGVHVKLNYL